MISLTGTNMLHFLYRTEADDDGDPYDIGIVQAATFDLCVEFVSARLEKLYGGGLQELSVRFYPIARLDSAVSGVWEDDGVGAPHTDVTLVITAYRDE